VQVNVAPLDVVDFLRDFLYKVRNWHVEAFFEEFEQADFGFAFFEHRVFGVAEAAFTLLLGAEDAFEYGYDGF
jgi:hypothetical protein